MILVRSIGLVSLFVLCLSFAGCVVTASTDTNAKLNQQQGILAFGVVMSFVVMVGCVDMALSSGFLWPTIPVWTEGILNLESLRWPPLKP
jgi:hypothetical protein